MCPSGSCAGWTTRRPRASPQVDRLCQLYDTGGEYSCQNVPVVALNADRWRSGTDTWPGRLVDYRTMLVNHEVGHLLGQHHPQRKCARHKEPLAPGYEDSPVPLCGPEDVRR